MSLRHLILTAGPILIRKAFLMALAGILFAGTNGAAEENRAISSKTGPINVEIIAGDLERPWSLEFLPDGRMLVSERPGALRIINADGRKSAPVTGLPEIFAKGQGGLLDLVLSPNFAKNRLIYFSFSEPKEGQASTAVARAGLNGNRLENLQVIFRQSPKVEGGNHFGSRLIFARDGTLFITTGERFKFGPAQDLSSHLGKILRINADGSIPADNPFVKTPNARPEIWSYGHRNVQGAAIHPDTGILWINEFGPRGGDELNVSKAGGNYGWPLVSWGKHYNGTDIPDPSTRPDFIAPIAHWTPVISPSGMTFYTGDLFANWRGNLLIAGLSSKALIRLSLKDTRVVSEERLDLNRRIRDVKQGPDGAIYVLTDDNDGELLRLSPAKN